MNDSINARIKARRQELGMSDVDVARLAHISVDQYFDVEAHADEFVTVLKLAEAKRLCNILGMDIYELIGLQGLAEQGEKHDANHTIIAPRNEVIARKRESANLSRKELADAIGFDEEVVFDLERDPDYLDGWSIELIYSLAAAIGASQKVLIGE